MCLVRQCKIGYVALEGLTGVFKDLSCKTMLDWFCCFERADRSLKDLSCKTM